MLIPIRYDEIDTPLSLNEKGGIATIGDWIDQEAPPGIRAAFGRAARHPPSVRVKSIGELDRAELRTLAVEIFSGVPHGEHVKSPSGDSDLSGPAILDHLRRESGTGLAFMAEVRMGFRFLQMAIKAGHVEYVPDSRVKLPDFVP